MGVASLPTTAVGTFPKPSEIYNTAHACHAGAASGPCPACFWVALTVVFYTGARKLLLTARRPQICAARNVCSESSVISAWGGSCNSLATHISLEIIFLIFYLLFL